MLATFIIAYLIAANTQSTKVLSCLSTLQTNFSQWQSFLPIVQAQISGNRNPEEQVSLPLANAQGHQGAGEWPSVISGTHNRWWVHWELQRRSRKIRTISGNRTEHGCNTDGGNNEEVQSLIDTSELEDEIIRQMFPLLNISTIWFYYFPHREWLAHKEHVLAALELCSLAKIYIPYISKNKVKWYLM